MGNLALETGFFHSPKSAVVFRKEPVTIFQVKFQMPYFPWLISPLFELFAAVTSRTLNLSASQVAHRPAA
jgi:hypothetical protein